MLKSVSSGHGGQLSSISEHHTAINERSCSTCQVQCQPCHVLNRTRPLGWLIRLGEGSFLSYGLSGIDDEFLEQRLGDVGREH